MESSWLGLNSVEHNMGIWEFSESGCNPNVTGKTETKTTTIFLKSPKHKKEWVREYYVIYVVFQVVDINWESRSLN